MIAPTRYGSVEILSCVCRAYGKRKILVSRKSTRLLNLSKLSCQQRNGKQRMKDLWHFWRSICRGIYDTASGAHALHISNGTKGTNIRTHAGTFHCASVIIFCERFQLICNCGNEVSRQTKERIEKRPNGKQLADNNLHILHAAL